MINKGYTEMIKRMYNIEVKSVSNGFGKSISSPNKSKMLEKTLKPPEQSFRVK